MVDSYGGVGRNDPCPCGSGKKFKKCCLNSQRANEPPFGLHPDREARSASERAEGAIPSYDPFVQPDPDQWLALDEQERIDAVVAYHRDARIRLPQAKLHAVVHVVVENQIAAASLPVRATAQRLMSEGLDRHDAIHAIGSVLTGYLNDLARGIKSGGDDLVRRAERDSNEAYFAELKALTADAWRRSG